MALDLREANNVALVPDPVPEEVIAQNIDYRQQVAGRWRDGGHLSD
jgi:hypothetical protein